MHALEALSVEAHNISDNIGVIALAKHADLLLDVCNLVPLAQLDDLDSHELSSGFEQGFVD